MMSSVQKSEVTKEKWWSGRDLVLGAVWGSLSVAVLAGFLFRDQSYLNNEVSDAQFGRIAILVGFGLTALALFLPAALYIGRRSGRLSRRLSIAIPAVIVVLGLAAYLPLSFFHERSLAPRGDFHSYLQLTPPTADYPPPGDKTRILCLGGSTTAWPDETDERWTDKAEILLEGKAELLNQAKEWFTTQHSLINYQTNLREVDADIVVVMHAINDFLINADHSYYSSGPFRDDYGHCTGPLTRLRHSKPFLTRIGEAYLHSWYWFEEDRRNVLNPTVFPGEAPFERNLRALIDTIRADSAAPILMTQASLYKDDLSAEELATLWLHKANGVGPTSRWSLATGKRGMERYNAIIRAVATDCEVPLIDLEAIIPKDLDHLRDDCHYRKKAIDLIAESVATALRPML